MGFTQLKIVSVRSKRSPDLSEEESASASVVGDDGYFGRQSTCCAVQVGLFFGTESSSQEYDVKVLDGL